jgi:hypothetical protein
MNSIRTFDSIFALLFLLLFFIATSVVACPSGQTCCNGYRDGQCLGECKPQTSYCHWRPDICDPETQLCDTVLENCQNATHICISVLANIMPVFDSKEKGVEGDSEEWDITLKIGNAVITKRVEAKIGKDNYVKLTSAPVCIPKDSAPFDVLIRGFEDDEWFTFTDDPIPVTTLKVSSVCSNAPYTAPDYTETMNIQDVTYEKQMGGLTVVRRRAQYIFTVSYVTPSEPGQPTPHFHKCRFGYQCCGVEMPDGGCDGPCINNDKICP